MGTLILKMPLWLSLIMVLAIVVFLAGFTPVMIRRIYRHESLKHNNEVAGFNYAVLGAVYSVLLAFMTLAVYEEYKEGRNTIRIEASSITTLYQMAGGLSDPTRSWARNELIRYTSSVVKEEWPLMEKGLESGKTKGHMAEIWRIFIVHNSGSANESAIHSQSLGILNDLQSTRQRRITSSQTVIPGFMWFVLIMGAGITIAFSFFFGAPNLKAQVLMTTMLTVLITLILLLIVHLDNPFFGPISVSAEPFLRILQDLPPR